MNASLMATLKGGQKFVTLLKVVKVILEEDAEISAEFL